MSAERSEESSSQQTWSQTRMSASTDVDASSSPRSSAAVNAKLTPAGYDIIDSSFPTTEDREADNAILRWLEEIGSLPTEDHNSERDMLLHVLRDAAQDVHDRMQEKVCTSSEDAKQSKQSESSDVADGNKNSECKSRNPLADDDSILGRQDTTDPTQEIGSTRVLPLPHTTPVAKKTRSEEASCQSASSVNVNACELSDCKDPPSSVGKLGMNSLLSPVLGAITPDTSNSKSKGCDDKQLSQPLQLSEGIGESKEGSSQNKESATMETRSQQSSEQLVHSDNAVPHDQERKSHGFVVEAYGSYRMGVHDPGSDMDTVVIVPQWADKNAVFQNLLMELKRNDACKQSVYIDSQVAPHITCEICGISTDISVAVVDFESLEDYKQYSSEQMVSHAAESISARALLGPANCDAILARVNNKDALRLAIRFVKAWAKRRGIYSNIFGFLGGMSCSLLVALVCQLYPNACASKVVRKFFTVYDGWPWRSRPIVVDSPKQHPRFGGWNPANRFHSQHLLPAITPVPPSQNAAFNINLSTLHIISQEINWANCCFVDMSQNCLASICQPDNFFLRYTKFMVVEAGSSAIEEWKSWKGMLESQLRKLIAGIPVMEPGVTLAHCLPQCIDPVPANRSVTAKEFSGWFVVGLRFLRPPPTDGTFPAKAALENVVRSFMMELPLQPEQFPSSVFEVAFLDKSNLPEGWVPKLHPGAAHVRGMSMSGMNDASQANGNFMAGGSRKRRHFQQQMHHGPPADIAHSETFRRSNLSQNPRNVRAKAMINGQFIDKSSGYSDRSQSGVGE